MEWFHKRKQTKKQKFDEEIKASGGLVDPLNPSRRGFMSMAGTAAIGAFLLWRYGRPHATGAILGTYLALYSTFRIFVEFFREEGARTFVIGGFLSTTQCVAAGLVVLGLWLLRTAPRRA